MGVYAGGRCALWKLDSLDLERWGGNMAKRPRLAGYEHGVVGFESSLDAMKKI